MNHTTVKLIPSDEDRKALFRSLRAWTGNSTIAEDLVQQTMIEAWKSERQPMPAEWRRWLFGIARNVLLRWRRELASDLRRTVSVPANEAILAAASLDSDIDAELEQQEVVSLLHDVLDELPTETRKVLLLKYIHELPQAEIASLLGLHEKALEGRLHRGKQKLRSHLLTYQPDTAISLGIINEENAWQSTDIWCTTCGMQQLEARWFDNGSLRMDCPACTNGWYRNGERSQEISGGIHHQYVPIRPSFRKAINAVHAVNDTAMAAGRDGSWQCTNCGGTVRPHAVPPDPFDSGIITDTGLDLCYACDSCGGVYTWRFLPGSGIYTSAGKQFELRNKRVRMLRPIEEERHGRPTIRTTWRSINDSAEFITWYDLETWRLLDAIASDDPHS